MADVIQGLVEKMDIQNGPNGKWKKMSVLIKGKYYSGFINPDTADDRVNVKAGDTVTVEYQQNGKYYNITNLKINSVAKAAATPTEKVNSDYISQKDREFRITYASARNAAIDFVRLALDKEALTLGKTKAKAADNLLAHVEHYTNLFAAQLLNADINTVASANFKTETSDEESNDYSE